MSSLPNDALEFFNTMKKVAKQAIEASQPSDFCFGKVINTSPLKISVEQKMMLGTAQLVLSRNVTDFKVNITVDWNTGKTDGKEEKLPFSSHNHTISGNKTLTVHNALKNGDEVILLKQKGGQKYLVLDRVVSI